jgi:putative tricarboxylic transport membrane protein
MVWDRVVGLAVVALGIAYWRAASALPKPLLQQDVGPEVFPQLIAAALIGLGAVLAVGPLVAAVLGWPVRRPASTPFAPRVDATAIVLLFAGLAAYTWLFERLGFILASVLFMAFEIAVLEVERRRWPWALPAVVLLPLALYLLFVKVLGVTLPAGILG